MFNVLYRSTYLSTTISDMPVLARPNEWMFLLLTVDCDNGDAYAYLNLKREWCDFSPSETFYLSVV